MPISVPPQKTVTPGEPVTAEGWNAIVGGVTALTQYLNATEASGLRVLIKNPERHQRPCDRHPGRRRHLRSGGARAARHGIHHRRSASRRVHGSRRRAGLHARRRPITAPVAAPVEFSLKASGAFMPELFGLTLRAALQELSSRKIAVARILDVVGRDVAPANPGSDYNDQPILVQVPSVGTAVPPEGQVQLVVSASLQVQASVEVPSLAGLTLAEAQKALEAIGLVLGKVVTKS